jgi:hypothetical protein
MNWIKRMREGDGVPAAASDSGGAGVEWCGLPMSDCGGGVGNIIAFD